MNGIATSAFPRTASLRRATWLSGGLRLDRQSRTTLGCGIALSLVSAAGLVIGFKVALGVITAAGFALAVAGLRRPMLGALGIGVLCSLDSLIRVYLMTGGLLRYNTFNYWLILVILFSLPIQFKLKDVQTRLLQFLVLLLTIQMVIAPSMRTAILHMLNLVTAFGLLAYFYRCRKNPHAWYVLGVSIGMLSAMTGFALFFNQDGLSFSTVDELAYLDPDYRDPNYIDPNALGYTFLVGVFSLCLAMSSVRSAGRRAMTPLLVLLGINFCWILLVGSRGSMLVGSCCLVYVMALQRSGSVRFRVALIALAAVLLVVNVFPQYLDRSFGRVEKLLDSRYTAAQRTSARSDLAIGAWRLFLKYPLGVGTGGFKKSWSELDVSDLRSSQAGEEKAAHSAWVKTLSENGLPGFLLLAAFVGSFAYIGFKQQSSGMLPIGVLVTVMLSSAFLSTEFQSKGIWYVVATSTVFLNYRARLPSPAASRRGPMSVQRGRLPVPTSAG